MEEEVEKLYRRVCPPQKELPKLKAGKPLKKADMHLHTSFSKEHIPGGRTRYYGWEHLVNFLVFIFSIRKKLFNYKSFKMPDLKNYELYSHLPYSPKHLFDNAVNAGMDFVPITDHNTIDGALWLMKKYPRLGKRVIIGEEVSAFLGKRDYEIHVGVFGINEKHHEEIQARREKASRLVRYLKKNDIVFALNHISAYNWSQIFPISKKQIKECIKMFDIFEVRNGIMGASHNKVLEIIATLYNKGMIAGTDTHCLRAGRTYTAAYASSKEGFLQQVKNKESYVFGKHGSTKIMESEVMDKFLNYHKVSIDGQKIFSGRNAFYDFVFKKLGARTVGKLNEFLGMQLEQQNLKAVFKFIKKKA